MVVEMCEKQIPLYKKWKNNNQLLISANIKTLNDRFILFTLLLEFENEWDRIEVSNGFIFESSILFL